MRWNGLSRVIGAFVSVCLALASAHASAAVAYSLINRAVAQDLYATQTNPIVSAQLRGTLDWLDLVQGMPVDASWVRVREAWVAPGARTLLSWNSPGSAGCDAYGAWSGPLPSAATAAVGPIYDDAGFVLNCRQTLNGVARNDFQIVSVSVRVARLSWSSLGASPNTRGGFRIEYGTAATRLDRQTRITDPQQFQYTLALDPGTYYFRVVSLDGGGAPTAFSNVAMKQIW